MSQDAVDNRQQPIADELSSSPNVAHLVATAAHSLRNPLAAISTLLQLHQEEPRSSSALVDQLQQQLQAMTKVLDSVAAFAPLPRRSDDTSDLLEVIWDILGKVHPIDSAAGPAWNFVTTVDDLPIAIPQRELQQVVSYLLGHLLATTPPTHRLKVTVDDYEEADSVLGVRRYLRCCFCQGGSSLAQTEPEGFEDGHRPGLVFGLRMCRGVMRHYGYSLRLFRGEDGSARFTILVPAIAEGQASKAGDPNLI